jgi:hypothetical protein
MTARPRGHGVEGDQVAALVSTSDSMAEQWPRLDEFEGEGCERVMARVRLPDGGQVPAHVYVVRGPATPQRKPARHHARSRILEALAEGAPAPIRRH